MSAVQVAVPSREELDGFTRAVADGLDAAQQLGIVLMHVQQGHNDGALERPVSWEDVGLVFKAFDQIETDAEFLTKEAERIRQQLVSLWLAANDAKDVGVV